jgi:DNA polymerase III delta prime subunit
MSNQNFLFVEKYRPQTIDECVLSDSMKDTFKEFVSKGQIPHMLFSGTAGTGKTTLARAVCRELGADLMYINASNESGIDTIRNKVIGFASVASFEGNLKVIILDECDHVTAPAQAALRATMEEFSATTRFILTCNFKNRIIDPLISRCSVFEFRPNETEKKDLTAKALRRVVEVMKKEEIEFELPTAIALVKQFYPDMRKILNEVQRSSSSGKLDADCLANNTSYDSLNNAMRTKKYMDVRKWVAQNPDLDANELFRYYYDNLTDLFEPKSIPQIVLMLAQYQHYAVSVVDQEINIMACLTEIMSAASWK